MPSKKTNILFIITDQHNYRCLGAAGHNTVKTPNFDALAADGVVFDNAYCGTMACGPSRASIFSGVYADSHKMQNNNMDMRPADLPVIPELLKKAGYQTALIGKLHVHPFERTFGFDHFVRNDAPYSCYMPFESADSAYIKYLQETVFKDNPQDVVPLFNADEEPLMEDNFRFTMGTNVTDEKHHMTTWTAREAIRYLKEIRNPGEPFFLNLGLFGPHQPFLCPGEWETMYKPEDITLPENFDTSIEDKPIFGGSALAGEIKEARKDWSIDTYKKVLSAYYGNVSMIDHYMGQVFDTLKALGIWEETMVIFTADHGDFCGQYRSFYKGLAYEGSAHVPLIVRDPRTGAKSAREQENVCNIDCFATCLDAAGINIPEYAESKSLLPLIAGDRTTRNNTAFYKNGVESAIMKDHLKLMRSQVSDERVYELYDLAIDRLETINRIADPKYLDEVSGLKSELDAWHEEQDRKQNIELLWRES